MQIATHRITGEKVVIKIFDKLQLKGFMDMKRMAKEIQILKMVRHPHIIQLFEIVETKSHIHLITEYASKGELLNFIISNGKFKEEEACKYFYQLISGLQYLHSIGVAHRDLKPENLLLDDKSDLKIADFGLSNTYNPGEQLETNCGTPSYTAPEILAGSKYSGLKVDIWSAGVILYTMVCGCNPFDNENTSNLHSRILKGEYDMPNYISNELKGLLKGILEIDPNKRFNLEEIKQNKWCQLWSPKNSIKGIIIGVDEIPIDKIILRQMMNFDFDINHVIKSIETNQHNQATTAYYLFIQRKQRLNLNDDIEPEIIDPNNIPEGMIFSKPIGIPKNIELSFNTAFK